MSKGLKIFLIALCMIVIGSAIFVAALAAAGFNFSSLGGKNYETNVYGITDSFTSVSVDVDTSDVIFAPSDDGSCKVVCYEEEGAKHSVFVSEGVLNISSAEEKWYQHIGINVESPKITVYLPAFEYDCINVRTDTGDVEIPEVFSFDSFIVSGSTGDVKCSADVSGIAKAELSTGNVYFANSTVGALDIDLSTGNVTISSLLCEGDINVDVTTGNVSVDNTVCKNLRTTGSTGDITLGNVVANENVSIERSTGKVTLRNMIATANLSVLTDTGDVVIEGADAAEIRIETDTGDVLGAFFSEKIFIARTDTGKVNVPRTTSGGVCEITTDTGDIDISIAPHS